MDEKIHLALLVISLSLLHHEVQTQKANFCNITESYFVEVPKTETIQGFKKQTGIFSMISGNKYENITRNVIRVEKRERVVEECCLGYKKKDDQCVSIDDTKPPKDPSSTTTTTSAPSSSTTAAPGESALSSSSPEPVVTQATTSESSPSAEPSAETPTTQPSPVVETTSASEAAPTASSEPPVTTAAPEQTSSSAEPISSSTTPSESPSPANTPESTPSIDSSAAPSTTQPSLVVETTSAPEPPAPEPMPSITEIPAQQSSETLAPPQLDVTVSESAPQDGPMMSSLLITMNTTPGNTMPIITPIVNAYSSSESASSTESAQFEKLVNNGTITEMDSTTNVTSSRRRRSLNELSNSVDSVEILDEELESNSTWTLQEDGQSGSREDDFKLNEKLISVQKKHHRKSDSDSENIVVSDLTADIEDRSYQWIEVLEVLSFGAVVFLLVITVQAAFSSETPSLWKTNSKIPLEIDSYGEFWVYDSCGNLEEV